MADEPMFQEVILSASCRTIGTHCTFGTLEECMLLASLIITSSPTVDCVCMPFHVTQ
jgi:hypothetical protein